MLMRYNTTLNSHSITKVDIERSIQKQEINLSAGNYGHLSFLYLNSKIFDSRHFSLKEWSARNDLTLLWYDVRWGMSIGVRDRSQTK